MNDFQWRDLAATLAMLGLLSSGERGEDIGLEAYRYADNLIAAKDIEVEGGILSAKKRKGRVSKQEVT